MTFTSFIKNIFALTVLLLSNAVAADILPNGNMELLNDTGFPRHWKFYQKDADKYEVLSNNAASGKNFIRITRNSKRDAFVRSDLFRIRPGKYKISMQLRGTGAAAATLSLYHPVRTQQLFRQVLSDKWQMFAAEFEVPRGVAQASLGFRISKSADIDDVKLEFLGVPEHLTERPAAIKKNPVKTVYSFAAKELTVTFSGMESGAAVTGIVNKNKRQFINFPVGRGLWSVRLKKILPPTANLPKVTGISCDPEMDDSAANIGKDGEATDDIVLDSMNLNSGKYSVTRNGGNIIFKWRNIDIKDEHGALDVTITVSRTVQHGIRFDGEITNRSEKYTVFYFNAPQIDGMGKIHGDGSEDFLATPHYLGRLIKNPASGKLFKGERHFRSNNSGHSMHFDALYSRNEGIFFGVWDPRQNSKRWDLGSSEKHGFSWSCVNIPDNMKCKPPQKYKVPYPVELRSFSGDWYDAAQIYRQWAIQQEWCNQGTLTRRRGTDIPAWFLDTTLWLHVSVNDILGAKKSDCERFFKDFKDHRIGIWLTHWGLDNSKYDFPNPDRFPLTDNDQKVIKKLQDSGFPISAYIQLTAWTRSMPSYQAYPDAEKNLLRNFYGQILSWGGSGFRKDSMLAYPGELWQQVLTGFTNRMVRTGFKVAYLDSGNHGGTHLNFTPYCTKNSGGGSDYVDNNRKLLTRIRQEGRKINSDFCTTTESFWEGNLHCLDAVLCVNSPSAYLEEDRVTAIPLAPVVYNDYALLFATHYGRGDLTGQAQGLIAKTAQALLWGIMPGWELPHAMYRFSDPERVRRTSKQRMEAFDAGRKFFVYGKMLRQPEIISDIPELMIPWGIGWSQNVYEVKSPAVLTSAFRAPDGTMGIVLYNLDHKPHNISVKLDDRECQAAEYKVVYPEQLSVTGNGNILKLIIPAQCPVIIESKGE